MNIGPKRHRVEIQARAVSRDEYGGIAATWETVATVWGEVIELSGRELWQAAQVRPDLTSRVTIRYYEGLTPKHRLIVDGRTLNIESVINPDGRRREHQLLCKEEV